MAALVALAPTGRVVAARVAQTGPVAQAAMHRTILAAVAVVPVAPATMLATVAITAAAVAAVTTPGALVRRA